MIDLYYWPTPNGWKITILLEELGVPYNVIPVNIGRGEQFKPDFLKISPNNRMPAIVDHEPADGGEPISIFESGAILLYLAEKHGRFLPQDTRGRYDVMQWLMWQMGGVGPMFGQANHFLHYAPEKIQYAVDRYTNEVNRLLGVLDKQLADREFMCGEYSIADMATWPWCILHKLLGQEIDEFPNFKRWFEVLRARPQVQKGFEVGKDYRKKTAGMDPKSAQVLFGQRARR